MSERLKFESLESNIFQYIEFKNSLLLFEKIIGLVDIVFKGTGLIFVFLLIVPVLNIVYAELFSSLEFNLTTTVILSFFALSLSILSYATLSGMKVHLRISNRELDIAYKGLENEASKLAYDDCKAFRLKSKKNQSEIEILFLELFTGNGKRE